VLQPGNSVRAQWRARLDEHLGNFTLEGTTSRAASLLGASHATYGVTHVTALCRLLPERDPHPQIYDAVTTILDGMGDAFEVATRIVRFELDLLAELGFGLDLESCAATGAREELAYVSPKSGRAVSRDAGAPWHDKLMRLPSFLATATAPAPADLADGFALTGFFLRRHVLDPRGIVLGPARDGFIAAVLRAMPISG
jgi:DNA repair protein RecO (recombination protein O)